MRRDARSLRPPREARVVLGPSSQHDGLTGWIGVRGELDEAYSPLTGDRSLTVALARTARLMSGIRSSEVKLSGVSGSASRIVPSPTGDRGIRIVVEVVATPAEQHRDVNVNHSMRARVIQNTY